MSRRAELPIRGKLHGNALQPAEPYPQRRSSFLLPEKQIPFSKGWELRLKVNSKPNFRKCKNWSNGTRVRKLHER